MTSSAAPEAPLGPVDFLVVEFASPTPSGAGLQTLLDLADADVVRILDVEFLGHDAGGHLVRLDASDLPDDPRLERLSDAYAGLLDDDDLGLLGDALDASSSAAVVVFESSWTATLDFELRAHGGRVASLGYVDLEDLQASLS